MSTHLLGIRTAHVPQTFSSGITHQHHQSLYTIIVATFTMTSHVTLTSSQKEQLKPLLQNHLFADHGYLKLLFDKILPDLPSFLKKLDEDRPLVIYDHMGHVIVRSETDDYHDALVLYRGGVDGDQFHIIVPPEDFVAPDDIGIPMEQKTNWGEGFKTAYVDTTANSLFEALAILLEVPSRSALASIVHALDSQTGPTRIIGTIVKPKKDHEDLRSALGKWCVRHHPQSLLEVLKHQKSMHTPATLPVITKPDAGVIDEERDMARHYLSRDTKEIWKEGLKEEALLRNRMDKDVDVIFQKLSLGEDENVAPGKNLIFRRFHELALSSEQNIHAVLEFYADKDVSRPSAKLDPSEDPNALFTGIRKLPIQNFTDANIRAMEIPQVDPRHLGRRNALGSLPPGPDIDIATVGMGMANSFGALEWAKIANLSGRKVVYSVYEVISDHNHLGRFLTSIFPGGAKAELGAMRFPPTSITFYFLVQLVLGTDAVARTFPNHHVMNSRFMLRELYGARGEDQDAAGQFETIIAPVYNYILREFAQIETTVDGEVLTYQDIEDFLVSPKMEGKRTANRAYAVLQAFQQIDQQWRHTYATHVEEIVRKGIKEKEISIEEKTWKRLFANEIGQLSQAEINEAELIVQTQAQMFLDVGKGTGGWGSYADMSIAQELITRSINSTEEFDFPILTHGVQEFGRLIRDKARQIGGSFFELHVRWNAKVCGLGKGEYDLKAQSLSKSALIYQDLDPKTAAPVGDTKLRYFDFIYSTVSPVVLARTVAPQMGGTGDKVRLEGVDIFGKRVKHICNDPFRVHSPLTAALDKVNPALKENNRLMWFWAHFTRMFGTTKVAFEVVTKLYDQVAPRDKDFPGMALPVLENIDARWIAVPVEREAQFGNSRDFTYEGMPPALREAQFQCSGKQYKWLRISQYAFDALPKDHPARSQRGPDGRCWLPVSQDRLEEFGGEEDVIATLYGDEDPHSSIDGVACVWMPVDNAVFDEMEDDDPIKIRFSDTHLSQQRAVTYVVTESWADAHLTEDKTSLMSVKTRAGGDGFYVTVPLDRSDEFEEDLEGSAWQLTDHKTPLNKAPANEIYRLRSDGPRVGGLQIPGGPRNFYVIPSPDGNTLALMEYNWDRDGHKLGNTVSSSLQFDTSAKPVQRLGDANSFLFGGQPNPIKILTNNATSHASMNYSRAENYQGAFAMLGPGDVAKTFSVYSFFKIALLFKYDPALFCPPSVLATGEAASLNPGWVNPALYATYGPIAAHVILAGGKLSNGAVDLFFGAPPLLGIADLNGKAYPAFGLKSENKRQTRTQQ